MTLSVETPFIEYTVTAAVEYNFDFSVFAEDELVVYYTPTGGSRSTKTLNVDYTVTIESDRTGSIDITAMSVSSGTLLIMRSIDLEQETDWTDYGYLNMQVLENAFDKLTMMCQQLQEQLDRVMIAEEGTEGDFTFPAPVANAVAAVWNSDGDDLEIGPTASEISSAQGYAAAAEAAKDAAEAAQTTVEAISEAAILLAYEDLGFFYSLAF